MKGFRLHPSPFPGLTLYPDASRAHARRKLFELAAVSKAPIAAEAVRRIDELFAIERELNGKPAGSAWQSGRSGRGP
ncbi:MAG: putative transposase [Methylobacterium brachiatum]|nr:putative transposase [Methylobacterium brachiatum]